MNETELVQGLRCQDPAALRWLYDCYLPSLWRFIYTRVNGNQHLAEDITSETILAMLTTIQSQAVNGGDAEIINPAGWLRTVAGRRITDHFRAASRVQHLLEKSSNCPEDSDVSDPARQQELEETRAEVRHVMDNLPDQYRLALEWKYLDKLGVREIAARWGMTEKAAESILFRARREFREQMMRHSPTDSSPNGKHSRPLPSRAEESANEQDAAPKSR